MAYVSKVNIDNTEYDIKNQIYFGTVDNTSTATAFTVSNVAGVTAYYSGLTVYIFNGVVATASGITININGLGAKKIYRSNGNVVVTSHWAKNTGFILIYNPDRDSGAGAWDWQSGYDTNDTHLMRYQYATFVAIDNVYRYQMLFQTTATELFPGCVVNNSTATSKTLNTRSFLPYGMIGYYNTTTNITAGSNIGASSVYQITLADLRYSFNTGKTLTTGMDVYLQCSPQADMTLKFSGNDCIKQALPSTEDGYVYLLLGHAYDSYRIQLYLYHPLLWYRDGMIQEWVAIKDELPELPSTSGKYILKGDTTGSSNSVTWATDYEIYDGTHYEVYDGALI